MYSLLSSCRAAGAGRFVFIVSHVIVYYWCYWHCSDTRRTSGLFFSFSRFPFLSYPFSTSYFLGFRFSSCISVRCSSFAPLYPPFCSVSWFLSATVSYPGQANTLSTSVLRTVWILLCTAMSGIADIVRSTLLDSVIQCPACETLFTFGTYVCE